MTWSDDDLRDALAPLAGDPRETAARVLAALPPPRRAFPWRVVAAGLAGLALGLLGGRALLGTGAEAEPVESAAVPPPPERAAVGSLRTVIGRVERIGPGGASEPLEVGAALSADDRVETQAKSYAAILLAGGEAELRLNAESAVEVVSERELRLLRGEVWARLPPEGTWRIDHAAGAVAASGAVVDVQAGEGWLRAATLEGGARVLAPDGLERLVKTGQALAIKDGIFGGAQYVRWPLQVTAWQFPLLCGQPRKEILLIASEMARRLDHPEESKVAEMTLRELGPCSVDALLEVLDPAEAPTYHRLRRRAALLLRDVATMGCTERLFELLADPDPDIRVAMHAAIARVTGTDHQDARFWSVAAEEERAAAVRTWRMAVYRD